MIHMVIEVDDKGLHPECTKEAVAERLSDLGGVTVVRCDPDKPKQERMSGYGAPPPTPPAAKKPPKPAVQTGHRQAGKCPTCGKEVQEVPCSDGKTRLFETEARCYQAQGPELVLTTTGALRRGAFDGRGKGPTEVGYPAHKCKREAGKA